MLHCWHILLDKHQIWWIFSIQGAATDTFEYLNIGFANTVATSGLFWYLAVYTGISIQEPNTHEIFQNVPKCNEQY